MKAVLVVALAVGTLGAGCSRSDSATAKHSCEIAASKIKSGPALVLLSDLILRGRWTDLGGRLHPVRSGFVVICRFTAREAAPGGFAPVYVVDSSGKLLGEEQGSQH